MPCPCQVADRFVLQPIYLATLRRVVTIVSPSLLACFPSLYHYPRISGHSHTPHIDTVSLSLAFAISLYKFNLQDGYITLDGNSLCVPCTSHWLGPMTELRAVAITTKSLRRFCGVCQQTGSTRVSLRRASIRHREVRCMCTITQNGFKDALRRPWQFHSTGDSLFGDLTRFFVSTRTALHG